MKIDILKKTEENCRESEKKRKPLNSIKGNAKNKNNEVLKNKFNFS